MKGLSIPREETLSENRKEEENISRLKAINGWKRRRKKERKWKKIFSWKKERAFLFCKWEEMFSIHCLPCWLEKKLYEEGCYHEICSASIEEASRQWKKLKKREEEKRRGRAWSWKSKRREEREYFRNLSKKTYKVKMKANNTYRILHQSQQYSVDKAYLWSWRLIGGYL